MPRAELLGLLDPGDVHRRERRTHHVAAMAVHDDDASRRERARGLQHVRKHRPPGDLVQNLGQRGMHPLALPGGKHDDVKGHDGRWMCVVRS